MKAYIPVLSLLLILVLGACSTRRQTTITYADTVELYPHPYRTDYAGYRKAYVENALQNLEAQAGPDYYALAYEELKAMLEDSVPTSFERAVYLTENAYLNGAVSYSDFQTVLNYHTQRIKLLAAANNKADTMDFRVLTDARRRNNDFSAYRYTEQEKKELYRKALGNWAIFTYLTDTTFFAGKIHLPYSYEIADPFGMNNWANSQVMHLLGADEKKGNCFALTALFKILANRLNSEAYICTAPQHIYIQHRDMKGHFYNLELATKTFPGDGTLQTLTFTWKEAIMSGISLRRLKKEKQDIALCLVNLGKAYEHSYNTKGADFMLQCAELALQYDSLNLNALLLKQQVLEERVMAYAKGQGITRFGKLEADTAIANTTQQLKASTLRLYDLGYRQMPRYMQEMIMAALQKKGTDEKVVIQDRTPNPFTSIDVPAEKRRYSTLSRGLYEEVHERKDFEQYGRITLDTRSREIVKMEPDSNFDFLIDPVVFAWSVDPLADKAPGWSPYRAFFDNPIMYVDPDGAFEDEFDKDGNKISDLGGDQIDFYHLGDGNTVMKDRTSGAVQTIRGGEKLIRGYSLRDANTSWSTIFNEWDQGTGPTNSMFADFTGTSNEGPFESLHSAFSSYTSPARERVLQSSKSKGRFDMNYGNANPFVANDMWEQMWGRSNISWYKLGNKTLFMMNDSKSMSSMWYRLLPNWERNAFKPDGNTYQTYIWVETNTDIINKVNEVAAFLHLQYLNTLQRSQQSTPAR